jgi:hypothetical protein
VVIAARLREGFICFQKRQAHEAQGHSPATVVSLKVCFTRAQSSGGHATHVSVGAAFQKPKDAFLPLLATSAYMSRLVPFTSVLGPLEKHCVRLDELCHIMSKLTFQFGTNPEIPRLLYCGAKSIRFPALLARFRCPTQFSSSPAHWYRHLQHRLTTVKHDDFNTNGPRTYAPLRIRSREGETWSLHLP